MPSQGRIDLKESLEDSPKTQALIASLEGCITPLKDYASLLRDTFQACYVHQQKVAEGTDAMAKLLRSFDAELYGEKDSFVPSAFAQLGRYLNELHSCQEMLSTQMENSVLRLLTEFIDDDIAKLERLKEAYESARLEHQQAMIKYSRVSKKKDSEKTRFEANADLYAARRRFYQASLEYHAELNGFQNKRKISLLEPLLTYMHGLTAYFKGGHKILNEELEKLLRTFSGTVQKVHGEYEEEMKTMLQQKQELGLQFPTLCLPDPDPLDPFADYQPPKVHLTSNAGYLFYRIQRSGLPAKWDKSYFFTKDGFLYAQVPHKNAEILLPLNEAEASVGDVDDRRYVLQIVHPSNKKPLYLLAESEVLRDEWIATINNIAQGVGPMQNGSAKNADAIRLERERIRSWVNKEIREPNKKEKTGAKQLKFQLQVSSASSTPKVSPTRPDPPQKKSTVFPGWQGRQKKQLEMQEQRKQQPSEVEEQQKVVSQNVSADAAFSQSFTVKFVGCTEVRESNDMASMNETVRKVMAARSLKNAKPPSPVQMVISLKDIRLTNPAATKKQTMQIQLKDVLFCFAHPENERLFGIVSRTSVSLASAQKQKFVCHVLETEKSGATICTAVGEVMQNAWKIIQAKKNKRSASFQATGNVPLLPTEHPTDSVPLMEMPVLGPSSDGAQPRMKTSFSANVLSTTPPSGYVGFKQPLLEVPGTVYRSTSDSSLNTVGGEMQQFLGRDNSSCPSSISGSSDSISELRAPKDPEALIELGDSDDSGSHGGSLDSSFVAPPHPTPGSQFAPTDGYVSANQWNPFSPVSQMPTEHHHTESPQGRVLVQVEDSPNGDAATNLPISLSGGSVLYANGSTSGYVTARPDNAQ